jgi:hypothetical protein
MSDLLFRASPVIAAACDAVKRANEAAVDQAYCNASLSAAMAASSEAKALEQSIKQTIAAADQFGVACDADDLVLHGNLLMQLSNAHKLAKTLYENSKLCVWTKQLECKVAFVEVLLLHVELLLHVDFSCRKFAAC